MNKLLLCTCILLLYISCKHSEHKSSSEPSLLDNAIEAHGGWENWSSLDTVKYKKTTILYDADGNVEREIIQNHTYYDFPSTSGEYSWKDSINHTVYFKNGMTYRQDGDNKRQQDSGSLNSFQAAYYVLNMPWKLKDEGAEITDLGLETLPGGREVRTLQVLYPNEIKKDPWWYYFDPKTSKLVGNKVFHIDYYSLILNDEYVEYKSLIWNTKRHSYRVDSLGQVLYKRGDFIYEFQ